MAQPRRASSVGSRVRPSTAVTSAAARLWRASTSAGSSPGRGSIGLSRAVPPGWSLTTGIPRASGQGPVLALGVDHGEEPPMAVDGDRTGQERLDRRALPGADLTDHDHVRVGEHGPVELERVEVECAHSPGDRDAHVGPAVSEPCVGVERVQRAQVGHRRAVPVDAKATKVSCSNPDPGPVGLAAGAVVGVASRSDRVGRHVRLLS